ncbi:MAG: DUF1707 SHOCT-like domain-containing protein [Acidimicrobiales bacterium]
MNDATPGADGSLRASDAERDAVAAELRQHLEDGRLTMEEFSERLDEVYAARTHGQLARARRELPALVRAAPPPPPRVGRRPGGLARSLVGLVSPSLISIGVWLASGHQTGGFWPAWVMLASAAVALRRFSRGGRCVRRACRGVPVGRLGMDGWPPSDRQVPPPSSL